LSAPVGTRGRPLQVAIVGSGPSGFYAAEALLDAQPVIAYVDVIERLPVPYGLVRYGVAPDHPRLKDVILTYARIAEHERFRLVANVEIGRDVSVQELLRCYDAVVLANGAMAERPLDIPGEDLPGSHAAAEFVGWYNGHPSHRDRVFDLSAEAAVIIGQGNVALDMCRILAKPVDELRATDIAEHALEALAASRVREIHVIGRRGPAQAKFSNKELREMGELAECDAVVEAADLELDESSAAEIADRRNAVAARNLEILRGFAARVARKRKRCHFRFLLAPRRFEGTLRLERIVFEGNRLVGKPFDLRAESTGATVCLDAGLALRSVGFRGIALPGVPFDERAGVIPHRNGRVTVADTAMPRLYATGWIKRGATGIIGTNRADSVATVDALLADLPTFTGDRPGWEALKGVLDARRVSVIGFEQWLAIDAAERQRGAQKGKPREKFTRIEDMLAAAG
jgi:NADPH-dependent glutamate synthase beta subunit-like oxidoreductase